MNMKIALLTTDTLHHTWFLQALKKHYDDVFVINETTSVQPKFETRHSFEDQRDTFESRFFFNGRDLHLNDIARCVDCQTINDPAALQALTAYKPDILIVFGTRRIKAPLMDAFPGRIINLHGGDPEYYRGLDTHLWAIYNDDLASLETTLHILDHDLDTGAIIQKQALNLDDIPDLSQLRAVNTQACVDLCLGALKTFETLGYFITSPQNRRGDYYSFMPAETKAICVQKYQNLKRGGGKDEL